jgi:hypothetical protein
MSLKVNTKPAAAPAPLLKNAASAPVVYFDNVPVYGTYSNNVEIELATRFLMPKADGATVTADLACVAHLRCSPEAAAKLIDALTKAIEMHQRQAAPPERSQPLQS